MLTRRLYTALWWLALPALPLRLWWRGRAEPGYRAHIGERFGRYAVPRPPGEVVWVHAVSLGETRAVAPLVARILHERPHAHVLLTHMTATGRAAGAAITGERVLQAWLPYDLPFAVDRFVDHFAPTAGILVETEGWPNLIATAAARGLPLHLVNARLSARSARGYARAGGLARTAFGALAGVAAQSEDDAGRLRSLGAPAVAVTGNIKFDCAIPPDARALGAAVRAGVGADRPVWVAASTRDGEEALILDALEANDAALPPRTLTIIVPRHPQRFDAVAELLRTRGASFARRSAAPAPRAGARVLLGDTMGELATYYAAADLAFVGGSLLPLGGQNLLEPLALGVPTLVGPHTFNFAAAADGAVAAGAALRVADARELVAQVGALLVDEGKRDALSARAAEFMASHRGALDRLWSWLAPRLDAAAGRPSRSGGG
jgi:3-deoxy-D-manno-octulosonic-acid transferase